jgi:hypothetical protein
MITTASEALVYLEKRNEETHGNRVLNFNAKKLSFSDSPLAEQINKSIKVITLQTLSAGSTKLGIQLILPFFF